MVNSEGSAITQTHIDDPVRDRKTRIDPLADKYDDVAKIIRYQHIKDDNSLITRLLERHIGSKIAKIIPKNISSIILTALGLIPVLLGVLLLWVLDFSTFSCVFFGCMLIVGVFLDSAVYPYVAATNSMNGIVIFEKLNFENFTTLLAVTHLPHALQFYAADVSLLFFSFGSLVPFTNALHFYVHGEERVTKISGSKEHRLVYAMLFFVSQVQFIDRNHLLFLCIVSGGVLYVAAIRFLDCLKTEDKERLGHVWQNAFWFIIVAVLSLLQSKLPAAHWNTHPLRVTWLFIIMQDFLFNKLIIAALSAQEPSRLLVYCALFLISILDQYFDLVNPTWFFDVVMFLLIGSFVYYTVGFVQSYHRVTKTEILNPLAKPDEIRK
ncbi:hypothetical protein PCE1_003580 [Barthelona sp. PCE]